MGIIEGTLILQSDIEAQQTACCPVLCDWQQIGPTDVYLKFQDGVDGNGYIIDPDADITNGSRQVFGRDNRMGLLLGLRMRYTDEVEETATVIIKVFARTRDAAGNAQAWQILRNRQGDSSVTMLGDPSDVLIDSLRASTADPEAHFFDTQGCNEFLVGVVRQRHPRRQVHLVMPTQNTEAPPSRNLRGTRTKRRPAPRRNPRSTLRDSLRAGALTHASRFVGKRQWQAK